MLDPVRILKRLYDYARAVGVARALPLAVAIERKLPLKATKQSQYVVPPIGAVWLRDCVSDHSIFWQCLIRRQYDIAHFAQYAELQRRYQEIVASGAQPLIVDCGGNIGLSARWFAHQFPKARILVIEPDRENFALLQRNVAALGGRVEPILGGIWGVPTTLEIVNPDSGHAAYRVDAATGGGGPVRAYTINELLEREKAERILICKIDIEGAQTSVFAENTEWVDKTDAILIELDDWRLPWQGTSIPFFERMSRTPFDYLLHGETLCCFRHLAKAA
jgi:FkbM family methyltransferase